MKTVLLPFSFLGLILLFACNDDGSVQEEVVYILVPDEPPPEKPEINKFVSIGDSLTEGNPV